MKIKIGDVIYDAENEPIMIILSDEDKKNIENMYPEATKYCCFPEHYDKKKIDEFMKTNENTNKEIRNG